MIYHIKRIENASFKPQKIKNKRETSIINQRYTYNFGAVVLTLKAAVSSELFVMVI